MKKEIIIEIDTEAPDTDTSLPWDDVVKVRWIDGELKVEATMICELVMSKEVLDDSVDVGAAEIAYMILERLALDVGMDLYPKMRTKIEAVLAKQVAVSG